MPKRLRRHKPWYWFLVSSPGAPLMSSSFTGSASSGVPDWCSQLIPRIQNVSCTFSGHYEVTRFSATQKSLILRHTWWVLSWIRTIVYSCGFEGKACAVRLRMGLNVFQYVALTFVVPGCYESLSLGICIQPLMLIEVVLEDLVLYAKVFQHRLRIT